MYSLSVTKNVQNAVAKAQRNTPPTDELVARDLERQRDKFNLSDEQWKRIGSSRLLSARKLRWRRRRRTSAVA